MHKFKLTSVLIACALGLSRFGLAAEFAATGSPAEMRAEAAKYEHASGVKQDYGRAYRLYCQAARLGDRESSYNLGFMYFNGRGIPRHLGLAMGWFTQAARQGDVYAKRMLKRYPAVAVLDDSSCPAPQPTLTLPSLATMDVSKRAIVKLVNDISPKLSVDAALVLAVIDAESGFNPAALSPKNAQGLMQLIPATAERFGVRNVWDPAENIIGGVTYINWLLRHFGGNVEHALAAYNAGEKNVESYQGVPPFGETQAYVKRIMGHYRRSTHPIPPAAATDVQTLKSSLIAAAKPDRERSKGKSPRAS